MEDQNKIIERIRKLFSLAEGKASNKETANEALVAAKMAHDLLLKYRLTEDQIRIEQEVKGTGEFYTPIINVLGKTILENPFIRTNARTIKRVYWFEELGKIVAQNYFCVLGVKEDGTLELYGFAFEREIASFVILQMAENANKICKMKMKEVEKKVGTKGLDFKTKRVIEQPKTWMGDDVFTNSFHKGFREQLEKQYFEEKEKEIGDSDATKRVYEKIANDVIEFYNSNFNSYVRGYYSSQRIDSTFDEIESVESAVELGKSASRFSTINLSRSNSVSNVKKDNQSLVSNKKIEYIGDVFLEIDVSGSMSGDKLSQAKDGAIDFAKDILSKGYKVGLISFSDDAKLIIEPTNDLSQFQIAVSKLEIEGSTFMNEAIRLGMQELKNRLVKRALCICTDGQTSMALETEELARLAKLDGIEIICVGTYDANLDFLNRISSKTLKELVEDCNLRKAIGGMAKMLTA